MSEKIEEIQIEISDIASHYSRLLSRWSNNMHRFNDAWAHFQHEHNFQFHPDLAPTLDAIKKEYQEIAKIFLKIANRIELINIRRTNQSIHHIDLDAYQNLVAHLSKDLELVCERLRSDKRTPSVQIHREIAKSLEQELESIDVEQKHLLAFMKGVEASFVVGAA